MNGKGRVVLVSGIFLAASMVAFVVLNRWLVTDIGVLSYGRIWQLYVSYSDFGFVRRAFVGTMLSESGVNSLFTNEYHFAIFIHHVAIAILASLIAYYCISRKITDPILLVSIAFSPALIIHSGYSTGSLDVFVLILLVINTLFVKNMIVFSIIIVSGVLTHELFIFTVPAQFLAILMRCGQAPNVHPLKILILPFVVFTAATIVVVLFGRVDMPRESVDLIMRQKMPIAEGQHGLWSGYIEIASTVERNATGAFQSLIKALQTSFVWLIIPLIYIALLIVRLWTYSERSIESAAISMAVLAPLLTALVATDLYRWIAMSANIGILLTLVSMTRAGKSSSRWNIPLLMMCFLAPFGSAQIDRPFPMHQFIFERLMN